MIGWIIVAALFVLALTATILVLIVPRKILRGAVKVKIASALMRAKSQSNPQLKIIEGDKVLDEALRLLRYHGSLGQKLKIVGPRLTNLQEVWWAHKLRNTIVHELKHVPTMVDADRAIKAYEGALKDLGL